MADLPARHSSLTPEPRLVQRLREAALAGEVISPFVPGPPWGGADVPSSWTPQLAAGLLEPSDGYRFRPENLSLPYLLESFRSLPREEPFKVVDLGTGSGSLLLAAAYCLSNVRAVGLELQPTVAERLARTLRAHGLPGVSVLEGDLRETSILAAVQERLQGRADLVVANPPYFPRDWGRPSVHEETRRSTHCEYGDVLDFLRAAEALLEPRGRILLIYDAALVASALAAAGVAGLGLEAFTWLADRRLANGHRPFRVWLTLSREGAPLKRLPPPTL